MLIKRISRTITGIEFKLSRHIDAVIRMHRLNRLNRLVCSSLLLCALSLQAAPNYTEYARLLEAYVADDGVRYAVWAQNQADVVALDQVLESFDVTQLDGLSKDGSSLFLVE